MNRKDKSIMQNFPAFDNAIDGIESGLVKQSGLAVASTQKTKDAFNITIIQPARPDLKPFDPDEASKLPGSLLLASCNLLSHAQVLSAQQAVGNTLPYLFMVPKCSQQSFATA
jgi:hypothetical protein